MTTPQKTGSPRTAADVSEEVEDKADRKLRRFGLRARRFIKRKPEYDARMNILVGSVRSSKTWASIVKIIMLCGYKVTGKRILTGVSKQSIKNNVLDDLFEIVGEENYNYNSQSGELILFNSKWNVVGARDEGSEKTIRGMTVGVAVCDELVLMPRSFFMMLESRMSPKGARLYATTNPAEPIHWLKEEVLDNPNRKHGLGKDVWWETWTLDDNPNLDEGYKEAVQRSFTGVFYQRFILGLWVLAEGAIYRDCVDNETWYDDESRPLALLSQNGHVDHFVAVDYGTANPQCYGDFYDDGRNLWMEHEYYWDSSDKNAGFQQKTDSQYADDLIYGCGGWPGFSKLDRRLWPVIIVDPSAASFRAELRSRGLWVVDANNEVDDGIRRVSTCFKQRKLRIHKRCVRVRKDIESYVWNKKKADAGVEQPLKRKDHGADMVRYAVQTKIPDWRLAAA